MAHAPEGRAGNPNHIRGDIVEAHPDIALLERTILPLIQEENALNFLRQAVPQVLKAMEEEVLEAARTENQRRREQLDRLRQRVKQVDNLIELENISDALFLPALLFDPNSSIWQEWDHPEFQHQLTEQKEAIRRTRDLLQHVPKGSLQYHQLHEQLRRQERDLLELYRRIFLEWLAYEERLLHIPPDESAIEWRIQTRLQIPIVVHDRLIDYADAELMVTASTRHAFITRTFAVMVIDKNQGLIQALRRINLVRYFLAPEVDLIVLTERADYADVLSQHQVHVHIINEATTHEPTSSS